MGAFRNDYLGDNLDVDALNAAMSSIGSAVHPMAPVHPVTGKRVLFVNRSFTQQVVGLQRAESDRLLQYLFSHMDTPNIQPYGHTEYSGQIPLAKGISRDLGQPDDATLRGRRLSACIPAHASGNHQRRPPRIAV
jgi:hypothetical protein